MRRTNPGCPYYVSEIEYFIFCCPVIKRLGALIFSHRV
jgi:hypothetical protein